MKEIAFLVNWGKDKEKSWSGTNYSLFKALGKYYILREISLKNKYASAFLYRLLRKDSMTAEYYLRKLFRHRLRNTKGCVFQFSEVLKDTAERATYMYVDATVSYINYLRKQSPKIYEVSSFQNSNPNILEKRAHEQDEYIKSCSCLFTMGKWLKEWLIQQGFSSSRVQAVGGGINVDAKLISPFEKKRNKILFIGKDFNRKGGYITYEAFKLLRQLGEPIELYVIGPCLNPINNPIDGYHFIGEISFKEEVRYYNLCDVFCMPSYFEAYGLVFIEALTFGLPCIGRNCYEMPYFINEGENGYLLKSDNVRELAFLIKKALNNTSLYEAVKSKRECYIQNYSWDAVANRISKVIG